MKELFSSQDPITVRSQILLALPGTFVFLAYGYSLILQPSEGWVAWVVSVGPLLALWFSILNPVGVSRLRGVKSFLFKATMAFGAFILSLLILLNSLRLFEPKLHDQTFGGLATLVALFCLGLAYVSSASKIKKKQ